MKIYKSITEFIGRTPLMELCGLEAKLSLDARILAKLEYLNPAGSVKDRAALYMLNDAEEKGLIKKGSVIIEPTSGNTGIGLAAIAAARGYRMIITMPETMSVERRKSLAAYGAELVLTPGALGMAGAVDEAKRLAEKTPSSFIPGQFENPANAEAHFRTTAPEIWEDTDGDIAAFAAGVGSGGTITGCGRFFKEKNGDIKIFAVEPASSPLLSKGKSGGHKIQGIGANFVPSLLDTNIYDGVIDISDDDAFNFARDIAKTDGISVGISSGAAIAAAVSLARLEEYRGKNIVVLLPDTGTRYMSTPLFDE